MWKTSIKKIQKVSKGFKRRIQKDSKGIKKIQKVSTSNNKLSHKLQTRKDSCKDISLARDAWEHPWTPWGSAGPQSWSSQTIHLPIPTPTGEQEGWPSSAHPPASCTSAFQCRSFWPVAFGSWRLRAAIQHQLSKPFHGLSLMLIFFHIGQRPVRLSPANDGIGASAPGALDGTQTCLWSSCWQFSSEQELNLPLLHWQHKLQSELTHPQADLECCCNWLPALDSQQLPWNWRGILWGSSREPNRSGLSAATLQCPDSSALAFWIWPSGRARLPWSSPHMPDSDWYRMVSGWNVLYLYNSLYIFISCYKKLKILYKQITKKYTGRATLDKNKHTTKTQHTALEKNTAQQKHRTHTMSLQNTPDMCIELYWYVLNCIDMICTVHIHTYTYIYIHIHTYTYIYCIIMYFIVYTCIFMYILYHPPIRSTWDYQRKFRNLYNFQLYWGLALVQPDL